MSDRIPTSDPSTTPVLSGIYAPVTEEQDDLDLPVVQGQLPEDLNRSLSPKWPEPPLQPAPQLPSPLDGNAMIHGI